MRIGQDLATTNNTAHLAFKIDDAGVGLSLIRHPDVYLFGVDVTVMAPGDTHAALVHALKDQFRLWLDDFALVLDAAVERVLPMLDRERVSQAAQAARIQTGTVRTTAPIEIYTPIANVGASELGVVWILRPSSLEAAVGVIAPRRRTALWQRGYVWGELPEGADLPAEPGSMAEARQALLGDLAAWRDSFRLECIGVAQALGEKALRATGRETTSEWPRFQPHPDDPSRCYVCGEREDAHGSAVGHCHPATVARAAP